MALSRVREYLIYIIYEANLGKIMHYAKYGGIFFPVLSQNVSAFASGAAEACLGGSMISCSPGETCFAVCSLEAFVPNGFDGLLL